MKPQCLECRWYNGETCMLPECKFESRREHADRLLDQLNEIIDHPCGNCLNHLSCFQEGRLKDVIITKDMIIMLPYGDDIFISNFHPVPVTQFSRLLKKYAKLGYTYLFTGTLEDFLDKYIAEKKCSKVKSKEEKERNEKYWRDKHEAERLKQTTKR